MFATPDPLPATTFWRALGRPPAHQLLCHLSRLHHDPSAHRSPVLLIHGFPDSPAMFAEYHTARERRQPWLQGRSIYALAFPNRHDNLRGMPSISDMAGGRLRREFTALVDAVIAASPTGKLLIVAHDWGATYTWDLVRRRPDVPIEALASLSVGSSFRFDIAEHGPLALLWLYNVVFGLPYYIPLPAIRAAQARALAIAGYRSPSISAAYQDCFHYWDWPLRAATLPLRLLGFGATPPFIDIRFPVLFLRSGLDRLASTDAFEAHLRARADSRVMILAGLSHWFPEQHADIALRALRVFPSLLQVQEDH